MPKEIKPLTSIRGLAALYVAIGHFFELTKPNIKLPYAIKTFIAHFGLSVDLFFILSSYLLMLTSHQYFIESVSLKNYFYFIGKRFSRIYPLLIACLTFVFVVINHFTTTLDYLKGLSLFLSLDGYRNSLFVLWSLRAEWITYLFFPLVIYLVNKAKLPLISFITIFLFSFFILFNLYKCVAGMQSLIRCWIDYCIGLLLFKLNNIDVSKVAQIKIIKYLDLVIFLIIFFILFFNKTEIFVIALSALLVIVMAKVGGVFSTLLENNYLHYLGLISYSIYLIHPILIYYIIFFHLNLNYTLLGIYIIAIIIISSVSYILIEKPGNKYFKPIFYNKKIFNI